MSKLTATETVIVREILLNHDANTLDAGQFGTANDINIALDHLRLLLLDMQDWQEVGREIGAKWFKTAPIDQVEYVVAWDITPDGRGWVEIPDSAPAGKAVEFFLDELEIFNNSTTWGDESAPEFIQGFVEIVIELAAKNND